MKINPKGEVPTLQLANSEILTENAVILQYLAREHHATQLLPPDDDFDYYRVLEWLNFITTDLHKGIGLLFNPLLPEDFKNHGYLPIVFKRLAFVNARLENNHYLMGNSVTLPDFYLFVVLRWAKYFKLDFSKMGALDAFFDRISEHPSVHLSLQQEHLAPNHI